MSSCTFTFWAGKYNLTRHSLSIENAIVGLPCLISKILQLLLVFFVTRFYSNQKLCFTDNVFSAHTVKKTVISFAWYCNPTSVVATCCWLIESVYHRETGHWKFGYRLDFAVSCRSCKQLAIPLFPVASSRHRYRVYLVYHAVWSSDISKKWYFVPKCAY